MRLLTCVDTEGPPMSNPADPPLAANTKFYSKTDQWLRDKLKAHGLSESGNRDQLLQRLVELHAAGRFIDGLNVQRGT